MYFDEKKNQIGSDGPKASMKFRPQSAAVGTIVPGPGAYNPNYVRYQTPSSRIGTGKRSGDNAKFSKDLPGPGTHEISYDWTKLKRNAGFGAS